MGARTQSRLSVGEIISRYQAGESQGLLSLRAKISCQRIRDILAESGIRIRGVQESLRLACIKRGPIKRRRVYQTDRPIREAA
jgi:hypothetical protein